jgi:two-component system KDP operon response regulator KdpE
MKTILVADDDLDILNVVSVRLRKFGYRVITAEKGVQAVAQAIHHHPDLIILDIRMPSGNGLSVYEKLKGSVETAFIPVIFFTAHPSADIRKKVLGWGASNFIAKPFTTRELIYKVKQALFEEIPDDLITGMQHEESQMITLHSYSMIA